jgi:hypothetical protein
MMEKPALQYALRFTAGPARMVRELVVLPTSELLLFR